MRASADRTEVKLPARREQTMNYGMPLPQL
jgi:hypothetical protein